MTDSSAILIYRDQLLPYSETFIPAQAEQLRRYRGIYVGTSRLGTPPLPTDRQVILGELMQPSAAWKTLYKLGGVVPGKWTRALRSHHPQLIHAHFGGDGGFAIPLAQRLKIPLVVTFHGYDATWAHPDRGLQWGDLLTQRGRFFRTLLLLKRTATFAAATRIIAVSEFIRDCLIELDCPADKISVHYIGIDTDRFRPDPAVVREPVVLFVGRLTEKKGCEYLIRAMATVQQSQPQARLVVIGDGPLRSQLEALAQSSFTDATFLGVQSPDEVRNWMNRAYCLCGPSITAASGDAEGLGMVFAEAQAMGLPVVAFASGGIPEVVQHDKTGLLVPEKDLGKLTNAILTLFRHPQQRVAYAEAGIQHIHRCFSLQQNTLQLEALYDQAIRQYNDSSTYSARHFA